MGEMNSLVLWLLVGLLYHPQMTDAWIWSMDVMLIGRGRPHTWRRTCPIPTSATTYPPHGLPGIEPEFLWWEATYQLICGMALYKICDLYKRLKCYAKEWNGKNVFNFKLLEISGQPGRTVFSRFFTLPGKTSYMLQDQQNYRFLHLPDKQILSHQVSSVGIQLQDKYFRIF